MKEMFWNQAKELEILDLSVTEQTLEELTIHLKGGELLSKQWTSDVNYEVVVSHQGKVGKMTTPTLDETILPRLMELATLEDTMVPLDLPEGKVFQDDDIQRSEIDEDRLIAEYLKEIQHATTDGIQDIDVVFQCSFCEKKIENTHQTTLSFQKETFSLGFEITAVKGEQRASSYASWISGKNDFDFSRMLEECKKNALDQLSAGKVEKGVYSVLLSHDAVNTLLPYYLSYFTGTSMEDGTSIFQDSFQKKVASCSFSLLEKPTDRTLAGYTPFDLEGTETYEKYLIKDGVFETILTDSKTAYQLTKPKTGNAFGTISVRNLCMVKGDQTEEELLRTMQDGIYITSIYGAHSGIDATSGTISVPCLGYVVRNGKLNRAIKDFILTTNYKEIFSKVVAIGNEMRQIDMRFGVVPILLENISITA